MRLHLLAYVLFMTTTLGACTDETGYPGDEAEDTDIVEDAKADGWMTDTPQGTYLFEGTGAETGSVVKLTLGANKKFTREIKKSSGAPAVQEGTFKFTQGGGNRYIRFLKAGGALLDRYGFEIHGRQLAVRKVGDTAWTALVNDDHFGEVQSPYAGTYTAYGRGTLPAGGIFELMLHDTGRFYMTIEAVHACSAPGHSCPSSWSDGFTGSTNIYGTWAEKTGGVMLTPRNDSTGAEGWKIDMKMTIDGAALEVTGKDGSLALAGPMDVRARFSGTHGTTPNALAGTWKVAKVGNSADSTVSLWGFALVLNGAQHQVTFDPETSEFCELSPNVNNEPKCGVYQIAGDPSGGTRGVLYSYRGTEFTALQITSKTATKMTLKSNEDSTFNLTKL